MILRVESIIIKYSISANTLQDNLCGKETITSIDMIINTLKGNLVAKPSYLCPSPTTHTI